MRSVRCEACGTKALMAASKCPKCGHPFNVRDGFGELLPLARCATCDSDYPISAGSCKWCGTSAPVKAPITPFLLKGIGVAAFLSLAVGAFLIRDEDPEPLAVVLRPAIDTMAVARTGDTVIAQPVLSPPSSGETATASQLVSTGVVGLDSTSTVTAVDSSQLPPAVPAAEEPATVAVGSTGTADSSTAAVDAVERTIVSDSARSREPWLPPPSVIRRAPTPGVTPAPPSTPSPNVATAPPAEEPPARTTPTRVADERRTAVAPPRATTSPARAKAKPPAKTVAKAPAKRTAPTVAASRSPRGKATATTSRTTAKAPAPRARTSGRWVNSVARRWVVVRADASGRARIIGSVGPDTRVQLGETRAGFRRIKAKGLAGWVDSRVYFAAAPAPRRAGRLAAQ